MSLISQLVGSKLSHFSSVSPWVVDSHFQFMEKNLSRKIGFALLQRRAAIAEHPMPPPSNSLHKELLLVLQTIPKRFSLQKVRQLRLKIPQKVSFATYLLSNWRYLNFCDTFEQARGFLHISDFCDVIVWKSVYKFANQFLDGTLILKQMKRNLKSL